MKSLRYVAMCALVAFMACAVVSVPVAVADPPPGKGNPMKGGRGNSMKGGGRGNSQKDRDYGYDESDAAAALVTAGITALAARDIARGYNLGGYRPLPPGIQKNLMRGKPLPPGIAKKYVPGGMLRQLPVHPGYVWRIAGRDLVLMAVATGIVADVLHDVFD